MLPIDPFNGLVHDEVMGIGLTVNFNFAQVIEKPCGVISVSISLAVVTEEAIKALVDWVALGSGIPKAPFSESPGGIACLLQSLSNCEGRSGDGKLPHGLDLPVSPAGRMPCVQT